MFINKKNERGVRQEELVAFLILQDELHSTDDQIARVLGITESTVRVVRSRIKGREK